MPIHYLSKGPRGVSSFFPPLGSIITGVGDSIMVASSNSGGADYDTAYLLRTINPTGNVGGTLACACVLPPSGQPFADGRMRFGGVHATGGLTTANVLANHVNGSDSPKNDSPKPSFICVLTGTNDVGNISPGGVLDNNALNTWKNVLQTVYTTLQTQGFTVVACSLPPNGLANNQPAVSAMNTAILDLVATTPGLIFADVFTTAALGLGWKAGYNVDNDHPNLTGAMAMGQVITDAVSSHLSNKLPALVTTADEAGSDIRFLNGCFQRDTNGDGIPQNGYTAESDGYWGVTANGATFALAPRTNYQGKAWTITKSSDPGDTTLSGTGAGGAFSPVLDATHRYGIGFVGEISSWSGTDTRCTVDLIEVTNGANNPFSAQLRKDAGFSAALLPFSLYHVFQPSASATYRFVVGISGADAANLATFRLGQLTLRDLGVAA